MLFALSSNAKNTYTLNEITEMEREITQRLEKNLGSYLNDISFSVLVKYEREEVNNKENRVGSALFTSLGIEKESYRIDKLKASVFVYEQLDSIINKDVAMIVEATLYPYRPIKFDVKYLESTKIYSEQLKQQRSLALGFFERLVRDNLGEIINFAAVIVISLAAIFIVLVLAKLLKAPLLSLVESLKKMANQVENEGSRDLDKDNVETQEIEDNINDLIIVFQDIMIGSIEKFKETILSSEENRAGFKKIIPLMYKPEIKILIKKSFSLTELRSVEAESKVFERSEFVAWLRSYVEGVAINTMCENWSFLSKVPAEKYASLKNITLKQACTYIDLNKNELSIGIMSEILKGDDKIKFLDSLSATDWKNLAKQNDIDPKEIEIELENILSTVEITHQEGGLILAEDIKNNLVLPSVCDVIRNKKLSEQDDFLLYAFGDNSEIKSYVYSVLFTPAVILQIPIEVITDALRSQDNDELPKIILSYSNNIKELLMNALPKGNLSVIVRDKIESKKYTEEEKEKAGKIFLEVLHAIYLTNAFSLHSNILELSGSAKLEDNNDELDFDFDDLLDDSEAA